MSFVIAKSGLNLKHLHLVTFNSRLCSKFHSSRRVAVRSVRLGKSGSLSSNIESEGKGPGDFFGIENDKGVKHVNEISCVKKLSDQSPTDCPNAERVLMTSFGHLRFDSDNLPAFHGQFDENLEDTSFSYGTNQQIERIQNVRTSKNLENFYMVTNRKNRKESTFKFYGGQQTKSQMLTASETSAQNDIDNQERIHIESSEDRQGSDKDLGFIDKMYFGSGTEEITSNESACQNNQGSVSCDEEPSVVQDLQGCGNKIRNSTMKENWSSRLSEGVSQSWCHEEINYVDNFYFGNLLSVDSESVCHSDGVLPKEISFSEEKQNNTDNCTLDLETKRNNTNMSFTDSYFQNAVKKDSPVFYEEKCDSDPVIHDHKNHINTYSNFVSENALESKDSSAVRTKQDIQENLCSSPLNESRLLNRTEQKAHLVSLNCSQISEKMDELKREILLGERKLEESCCSGVTKPEEKLESAHNYVLKLRKGAKDDCLSGEEQNSKRYKIFKEQVPDLSRLTRNELLDLLKDHVLFCNDDVVILDKPYNLVVHESQTTRVPSLSSVLDALASRLDTSSVHPQLLTVHRLDKETTGCLVLARNELAAQHLKSLFAQREIQKEYLVMTARVPDPHEGIVDIPIAEGKIGNKVRMVLQPDIPKEINYKTHVKNGKKAVTYYKVLSTSENAALVQVRPETGVKHQIRVHLGFGLNCPILGDHKYSHLTKMAPQKLSGDILRKLGIPQSKVRHLPLHIHARTILIPKFLKGEDLFVSAPLPEHIKAQLKSLKFK